jgi:hypothetical protein
MGVISEILSCNDSEMIISWVPDNIYPKNGWD